MKLTKIKLKELVRSELKERDTAREYKKVRKLLDQVRDGLSELVKYGEDYGVFQNAKFASKTLKKAWRNVTRVT